MLTVLAQMERDLIAERTKAELEATRARGRVGGRPRKGVDDALKLYDTRQHTVKEIERFTGVSKATLYRALERRKQQ